VAQISKVLPNDPAGRHAFVASGGFAKMQALGAAQVGGIYLYLGRCV